MEDFGNARNEKPENEVAPGEPMRPEAMKIRDEILESFEEASRVPPETTLEVMRKLDMIVVFEGNTIANTTLGQVKPTALRHADRSPFFDPSNYYTYVKDVSAMLGGGVRPMAAAQIAAGLGDRTPLIAFVGGNPLGKEKTHAISHSGSEVYKAAYEKWLKLYHNKAAHNGGTEIVADSLPKETVVLHDSHNSKGDIFSALTLALSRKSEGSIRVGFLSNEYHLPRLRAHLENFMAEHAEFSTRIEFVPVSAEGTILSLASKETKQRHLGIFNGAYSQPEGLNRIVVEGIGRRMAESLSYNTPRPENEDKGKAAQ